MHPIPDTAPHDSSSESSPLEAVIQSDLCAASWHAKQMRRVNELKAKSTADRETEQEAGKALFNVPSPFSPELLQERSRRGDYLRAQFHLLFMPIVTPMSQTRAPAGMGKTRECVQELNRLAESTVYYYTPTHDLLEQMALDLQAADYRHVYPVRGRTAQGMCIHENIGDISADIAAAGLSVQAELCGNPENEDGQARRGHCVCHRVRGGLPSRFLGSIPYSEMQT